MLETWNTLAFGAINAPADPSYLVLTVAQALASWLIYLAALGLVVGWIRGSANLRRQLIFAGFSAAIALIGNLFIASLWYHPRPFEIGVGHQFLAHLPEASFPSDHATVMFAVALGFFVSGVSRLWSVAAFCAALAVAWSRVYLGIHWPLDMLGSLGVAAIVVVVLRLTFRRHLGAATDWVAGIYELAIKTLGLPTALFPRRR